jgi:hypothetical protein
MTEPTALITDPNVIRGALTLVAAMLASSTALYIALFVYPQQKEIDRRFEIRKEQREAYRKFLRASTEMRSQLVSVTDTEDYIEFFKNLRALQLHARQHTDMLNDLFVLASQEVLEAATTLNFGIQRYGDLMLDNSDTFHANKKLAGEIVDLSGSGFSEWKEVLSPTEIEWDKLIWEAEITLAKAIRREEFSDNLEQSFSLKPMTNKISTVKISKMRSANKRGKR